MSSDTSLNSRKDNGGRWLLLAEGVILFVGLPLLMFWDLIPLPKITVLIIAAVYCGYQLWGDPAFGRGLLRRDSNSTITQSLLIRTPLVIAGVVGLVWLLHPERFFVFPTERPVTWMVVMVLYPVLSALPQEFIFRTFFFHRYGDFMSLRYAPIVTSALAFGFVHIIYDNWWAVGLGFLGGLLFGITYARTKSLFWVTVEHAIYGCLVFTIGMGDYFYEPF
jgi:membrane protease YdiL (CAAX protease family)